MTPDEAHDLFAQRAGESVGRFALGDEDVSHGDLYEAVTFSLIASAETVQEVFDPRNHLIAELFVTP